MHVKKLVNESASNPLFLVKNGKNIIKREFVAEGDRPVDPLTH